MILRCFLLLMVYCSVAYAGFIHAAYYDPKKLEKLSVADSFRSANISTATPLSRREARELSGGCRAGLMRLMSLQTEGDGGSFLIFPNGTVIPKSNDFSTELDSLHNQGGCLVKLLPTDSQLLVLRRSKAYPNGLYLLLYEGDAIPQQSLNNKPSKKKP